MKSDSWEIGPLESRLFSWSQMLERSAVRTDEVSEALRLSPAQTSKLLDRMTKKGRAIQLQRGLYLLPEKLPPGGRWQPPAEIALWHYFRAKGGKWQETGPSAFNYYELSEQVANVTTVYNNRVSGIRLFGRLQVNLIKVAPKRLGSTVAVKIRPGRSELRRIGTLSRIVFDAVYDYKRFGTLPEAYRWIAERKDDHGFLNELVRCVLRFGNVASRRRIGWLLERLKVTGNVWKPLIDSVGPTSSFIPLDPTRANRGQTIQRWGVTENLDEAPER